MQSISTQEGVEGKLLLLREGWKTNYYYAKKGERWLY